MRILYWTDLFLPHIGGIETFSMDLVPALQARGHEVIVVTSDLTLDTPRTETVGGIPVHRFPTWNALRTNDLRAIVGIRNALTELKRRFRPDVAHVHFGATTYTYVHTQRAVPVPTVTTVHAIPDRSLTPGSLFAKVVQASAMVNAVSVQGHRRLTEAFPEAAERISFVYYGLGSTAHGAVDVRPPSFEEPILLCLGRLTPQKGFDVALKAFAGVQEVLPRARLKVVGEGVEETALKELAAALGIAAKVDFTGSVAPREVFHVINEATMVLMPSRFEGLPLVALQAARLERPMISSDVDGLPELVVNGASGLVLERNDEAALAEAILFMAQHPERAVAMGRAAARRLEERFGFDQCVDAYERLYRRAAEPHGS